MSFDDVHARVMQQLQDQVRAKSTAQGRPVHWDARQNAWMPDSDTPLDFTPNQGLIDPRAMDPGRQGTFSTGQEYDPAAIAALGKLDPNDPTNRPAFERALEGGLGKGLEFAAFGQRNADLAMQNIGDQRAYEEAVSKRNIMQTGGWDPQADANRYYLGGNRDWAGNRAADMDARAAAMGQPSKYDATIAAASAYQGAGAGRQAQVADQFGGVANQVGGVAGQIGGAAAGQGYQGQLNAAGGLYALGQQQQGPSAAEMAMRTQAGQAMQQNAAMAAGARGANAGLGLMQAAQGNAAVQGNLIGQLGQQRANEDLAYRQQRAQALGAAGQAYGSAMGSQVNALGQQVNALGQQANVLGGQAQTYGAAASTAGDAGKTAAMGAQAEMARDEATRAYLGMGTDVAKTQLGADISYDAARTGNYLAREAMLKGGENAKAARDADFEKKLLGGGIVAAGTIAAPFTGGTSAAAVPVGAAMMR